MDHEIPFGKLKASRETMNIEKAYTKGPMSIWIMLRHGERRDTQGQIRQLGNKPQHVAQATNAPT